MTCFGAVFRIGAALRMTVSVSRIAPPHAECRQGDDGFGLGTSCVKAYEASRRFSAVSCRNVRLAMLTAVLAIAGQFAITARAGQWARHSSAIALESSSSADSLARKTMLDQALQNESVQGGRRSNFATLDGGLVLRTLDVDAIGIGAADSPNVLINPEPSSLLVWSTLAGGLLAAGYGFRHRRLAT